MNKKNIESIFLEEYKDVFCDIFNKLLFKGSYFDVNLLEDASADWIYKMDDEKKRSSQRDFIKIYKGITCHLISFGIEKQTSSEEDVFLNLFNYESAIYMKQVEMDLPKNAVISIVLNFTNKRMEKKSLHDFLSLSASQKEMVPNYKTNIIDVLYLDDETIESLESDIKHFIRLAKEYYLGNIRIFETYETISLEHPQEFADMLKAYFPEKSLLDKLKIKKTSEKEDILLSDLF